MSFYWPVKTLQLEMESKEKRTFLIWQKSGLQKERGAQWFPMSVILLCKNWLSPLIWLQLELVVGCEIVSSSPRHYQPPPPPALTRNNHHRTEKLIKLIAATTALLPLNPSTKFRDSFHNTQYSEKRPLLEPSPPTSAFTLKNLRTHYAMLFKQCEYTWNWDGCIGCPQS